MRVSKMIAKLQNILEKEGDLRITVFDEYTAKEGWDYEQEELWVDAEAGVTWTQNNDGDDIEKVVIIR